MWHGGCTCTRDGAPGQGGLFDRHGEKGALGRNGVCARILGKGGTEGIESREDGRKPRFRRRFDR
jgi:hypothetical protein